MLSNEMLATQHSDAQHVSGHNATNVSEKKQNLGLTTSSQLTLATRVSDHRKSSEKHALAESLDWLKRHTLV